MRIFLSLLTLLAFTHVAFSQIHERWDVKTISDGFQPTGPVKKVTVAKIAQKAKIGVRNNQPRLNFEKQEISITGTISRIQLESDGDYHIEVTDGTLDDSTLVCESVDPANSFAAQAPMIDDFKTVRALVTTLKKGDKVRFTGLEFQDRFHSPSPHRTRNFLEIHPIIKAEKL